MHTNFSVAISWGNKMIFSLYVFMSGFCSNNHIYECNNRCLGERKSLIVGYYSVGYEAFLQVA